MSASEKEGPVSPSPAIRITTKDPSKPKPDIYFRDRSLRRFGLDVRITGPYDPPPETDYQRTLAFLREIHKGFHDKKKRDKEKWRVPDQALERLARIAAPPSREDRMARRRMRRTFMRVWEG